VKIKLGDEYRDFLLNRGIMMGAINIKAEEIYIKDLFTEKFLFEIPDFQRPFAWEKDNFDDLFEDINDVLKINLEGYKPDNLEPFEPYFLGSIILWAKEQKDDGSGKYAVIDGQQRLTSLTILMAVIRDFLTDPERKLNLQKRLFQKADIDSGTCESVRIKVRDKENDFFKNYILSIGGTENLSNVDKNSLSDPKKHIIEAINLFKKKFINEDGSKNGNFLDIYYKYLLQKVILVIVKTNSLTSAFRLFSIINTRGLPLNNADILKSENLRIIPDNERETYTQVWEDIEENIGTDNLEMLISFIRSIKLKDKAKKSIFEEFEEKIFPNEPNFKGKGFIEYLNAVHQIYKNKIDEATIKHNIAANEIYYYNLIGLMKNFLRFNDWMTAVIKCFGKFKDDSILYQFVKKFENKIAVDWVTGLTLTERLIQIFKIIKLIEDSSNCNDILNNSMFNQDIVNNLTNFENSLTDTNFYGRGRSSISKYVLLRIDMEAKDNLHKKITFTGNITVEHILPQTPTNDYWLTRFDQIDRLEWTNKVGNLVLLNGSKNSQASNKPFTEKVQTYFAKYSDFSLTNELASYNEWNLPLLKGRHDKLVKKAIEIWTPK
jgi:uncharacterized protein with ParB-like and HNH nuclease domain